ncbi:MAG: aldehyde dehydrogenase family protein, partial [Arthrobacter sp.]
MSSEYRTTSPAGSIAAQVAAVRKVYESGRTRPLAWRKEQLKSLMRMLSEREGEFAAALREDLGKNPLEAYLTEISITRAEAGHALKHLSDWTR